MECNFLLTMTVYNQKKVMVNVWWSVAGLVHNRFRNPIETITAEKFCRQINEMRAKLQYMCRDWVNIKGSILLHIYPRPYSSMTYTTKAIWLELRNSRSSSILVGPIDHRLSLFKHLDNFLRQKSCKTQSRKSLQQLHCFQNWRFLCYRYKIKFFLVGKDVFWIIKTFMSWVTLF